MKDIQNLIEVILSNPKLRNNEFLKSKIYTDEPILKTAAQMVDFMPEKYSEMKKLAKANYDFYGYGYGRKAFYEQGKFMEDFTDDYHYNGGFSAHYPTYESMNDQQLRGYFSWRTRVRSGMVEKTSLSFVYVYIYELLNQIGVNTAEEGFYTLKSFWYKYRDIEPQINYLVTLWLKDYVIYNSLDKSLLNDFLDVSIDNKIITLINHRSHNAEEVFSALNTFSSYKLDSSRFYKSYPDDVRTVAYNAFTALVEYHDRNRKRSLVQKFFGGKKTNQYTIFNTAMFYHHNKHIDCIYEINDVCRYTCKNGNWSEERFYPFDGKNKNIGELLKAIDFIMRQKYSFKSALKVDNLLSIYKDIIEKETDKLLDDKKKKAVPKIEIDLLKLHNIRKTALETQNKLIVEDFEDKATAAEDTVNAPTQFKGEPEEPLQMTMNFYGIDFKDTVQNSITQKAASTASRKKVQNNISHEVAVLAVPKQASSENKADLTDIEYEFMSCLLYSKNYSDLIKSNGLMLSVLTDTINEKLYDLFSDTVIIFDGDKPELIVDYVSELKEMIKNTAEGKEKPNDKNS